MKRLKNKTCKILQMIEDLRKYDLFFQALPEQQKRDLYKANDELKTFYDNLPEEATQ